MGGGSAQVDRDSSVLFTNQTSACALCMACLDARCSTKTQNCFMLMLYMEYVQRLGTARMDADVDLFL